MLVNFENIANTSKVWIYQSDRAFKTSEISEINNRLAAFISIWKRHGKDLKSSFTIKYNQFIIIAVDENYNNISGCSIDASINLMKQLEQHFQVDLTNKLNVSFKEGNQIKVVTLVKFQQLAKAREITEKTIVFNNLIATKAELENNWEVPATLSWHKRFLTVTIE